MPQSASLPLTTYSTISPAARLQLARELMAVVGQSNTRLLIAPAYTDTTTTTDLSPNAYTCTWDATIAARLSQLGMGESQTYNGSSQYGTVPDANNLSFGNGTTDSPFSIVALANITDTANYRVFAAKYNFGANLREYSFQVTNADKLQLNLTDLSTGNEADAISTAAITQGSFTLYGVSYNGVGGSSAANGITLYQNASSIAATKTTGASYVAMENTAAAGSVGAIADPLNYFQGSLPLVLLCATELSAAQHTSIKTIVNNFYGLSL